MMNEGNGHVPLPFQETYNELRNKKGGVRKPIQKRKSQKSFRVITINKFNL